MAAETSVSAVVVANIVSIAIVGVVCWWVYQQWGFWIAFAVFIFGEPLLTLPVTAALAWFLRSRESEESL
jgi:Zn-dependent protease with chaperone function